MTILHASGLNLRFGAVVAAADIEVAVDPGEVIGVIGANGAGKTTFVNLVTGYLSPDSGGIFFQGRDITGLEPRRITRLGIGRSFQTPQIFPGLSMRRNVLIALGIARTRGGGLLGRLATGPNMAAALEVLEHFGIEADAERDAGVLAQGTRKLLDIAMAMVSEPRLMLLDEPTSGVSAEEKFLLMDTLMEALKARETTVLFVEHDMELVERYGTRVLAFYEGRIIADGPPWRVLADPDVKQYIVGSELHRGVGVEAGGP